MSDKTPDPFELVKRIQGLMAKAGIFPSLEACAALVAIAANECHRAGMKHHSWESLCEEMWVQQDPDFIPSPEAKA
jgi:hypothetical protein